MNIHIDRDMLLVELYAIRAKVTDAALDNDDVKDAKKKIDDLISLISAAPQAENNANFPRVRVRR